MIQTIQLFKKKHLFQKKRLIIVFQTFEHPRLKYLFQHPNSYTSSNQMAEDTITIYWHPAGQNRRLQNFSNIAL